MAKWGGLYVNIYRTMEKLYKKVGKEIKSRLEYGKQIVEYLKRMESVIECMYYFSGITDNVYITVGDCFRTYKMYNNRGYKIELRIKKEMDELYESVEDFNMETRLIYFVSKLGHEFAHILNNDLVGITARERMLNWNKINKVLSVFSESRADITGKYLSKNCCNGWTSRWIYQSDTNPLKSGYLPYEYRKAIISKYEVYNKDIMIDIYRILQQYGLPEYKEFCNILFKNIDMNSEKGRWVRDLLFL